MLTKYLKILLICCFSKLTSAQLVETQRWSYVSDSVRLDTTIFISSDSVYMPFFKVRYAKREFEDLCVAKWSFDSLLVEARTNKTLYDSLPNWAEYPLNLYKKYRVFWVTKSTFKTWGKTYYLWEMAVTQTNEESHPHSNTYSIYYVNPAGIVAVVATEHLAIPVFRKRNYRLQKSWSNISHYVVSPRLLRRAWKEIRKLEPGIIE